MFISCVGVHKSLRHVAFAELPPVLTAPPHFLIPVGVDGGDTGCCTGNVAGVCIDGVFTGFRAGATDETGLLIVGEIFLLQVPHFHPNSWATDGTHAHFSRHSSFAMRYILLRKKHSFMVSSLFP